MTSQSRRKPRTTARRIRLPRTLCSLAAAALFAAGADAQQPVVYGGGLRAKPVQKTAGNGIPLGTPIQSTQRPVPTFATPFPSRPAPGPVPTAFDQPTPQQQPQARPAAAPVLPPRAGGAATPGAAGKVMYFHKAEGATTAEGPPDSSTVAQAAAQDPVVVIGVADVPAAPVGVPQPVVIPNTVIEKPIVPPTLDPIPAQPFTPVPLETPRPVPALTTPVLQPEEKKPDDKKPEDKKDLRAVPPSVTALPPREAIFTLLNNEKLEDLIYARIASQLGKTPEEQRKTAPFPDLAPVVPPSTPFVAKTATLPPNRLIYEPNFVIHRRLHFEEKNSERYGWDFGLATPFISTAYFYKDVLLLPNSLATSLVIGGMDTNRGKCMPGSPTPYYLYPQGLTITGGVAEGIVITGLSFIIP